MLVKKLQEWNLLIYIDFYLIFLMTCFSRALFSVKSIGLIGGDNSEVEDLSDVEDPVGVVEYQTAQQEQSSSEEDISGCEDSIPLQSPLRLSEDVNISVKNMKNMV